MRTGVIAAARATVRAFLNVLVRTAPLGNLDVFPVGARSLELITVQSDDLAKRILRFATTIGEIGIRFAGIERLRDGDVIYADDERVIAIDVCADDVLLFRPPSLASAIALAHALGNRHLPIQIDAETIVVRYDPLLEALGSEHGVPAERAARTVRQPFRHLHAPHRHD